MASSPSKPGSRGRLAVLRSTLVIAAAALAAGGRMAAAAEEVEAKGGQFAAGRPASAQYGPDAGRKCAMSAIFRNVLDELADAAKRAGRAQPETDGRLCAVAEAFLAWEPGSGSPRPQVLAFVSQWFGLPTAVQSPTLGTYDEPDERVVAEKVVQTPAGNAALNAVHPRIGMATQRLRKGKTTVTKVAIVVLDAPLELTPVPRRLERGQQAKLSGRFLAGVKNPKVFVSDATGVLSAPEQVAGEAFEATLVCGDRPGRILVEIRGELAGSSGIVAAFPVACGQEPPASVSIAGEPWPASAAEAERKILDLVNAERVSVGLSPVTWDAALAGVARSISEDLAARGGAPGGPDVLERMKKVGIASPLVLQSAAADRTFERAQDRILASPRDRATILNPEATNAGIGAVSATDEEGRPLVYVTEVLIKELPPMDVAKVRQQLRDAVAQKRKDARTNALAPDATLDEVAQKYAEALAGAGGVLSKEKAGELTAPLNKGFRTVTLVSGAKQEPLDFAEEPQTTAPAKALGVGAAQGRHPVLGRNAVYVVLMVGTPRAAAETPAKTTAAKKAAAKK